MHYLHLALAIVTEIAATSALQASQQFSRIGPSILVIVGFGASFYFLSLTLKVMPIGMVYAIWSGVGIVLIAAVGYLVFGQRLDLPAMIGIGLILVGVVVTQLFSATAVHS